MEKGLKNKKGQIAIFVILAVALVTILILSFAFRDKLTTVITGETPLEQIKKCVKEATQQGLDIISKQGGSIEPENYILYQGNKVDYVCYTEEKYKQCIMQKPFLKQAIEEELETFIQPKINSCIDSVKSSLEKKGYSIKYNQPKTIVEIFPNNILITLDAFDLQITKDKTESYPSVKTDINSKIYDLVIISSSIANWEARYGDAEIMNYMMFYPSLLVEKKPQDDGTKIYILTNKVTGEKFIFASKSVVIPVGAIEM